MYNCIVVLDVQCTMSKYSNALHVMNTWWYEKCMYMYSTTYTVVHFIHTCTVPVIHCLLSQVCNHPDLFERRDVVSPLRLAIPSPTIPRLLYDYIHHGNTHRHRYCICTYMKLTTHAYLHIENLLIGLQ